MNNQQFNKPKQPSRSSRTPQSGSEKSADSAAPKKSSGARPRPKHSQGRGRGGRQKTAWDISQFQVPEAEGKIRFHDLNLPDVIMHAIQDLGFEYCSPIQEQILPHTLKGLDAIGKAQTGTGKTAAYLITIIDDLLRHPIEEERYHGDPRALVIAPTRELVMQIAEDAKALTKYTDLHVVALFGGMEYHKQHKQMQRQYVDIVVATPGRLIDFMTRKDLYLDVLEALVLDEADRMLDMGFIPQVKRIVRASPSTDFRQTLLFSATFTQDIMNLASQWTHKPITVEIEPEQVATDTVEQKVYMVSNEEKFRVLVNILKQPEVSRVIIFTNRRDQTQHLFDKIRKAGFQVGLLSGEITQQKRTRTLQDFKSGKISILVATDVVGRGIHIEEVSHVINYYLPDEADDYVHRIGRTGRAGSTGIAINLACETESFQIPAIEERLGRKLKCELPPEELLK
ncbi:ATP-dependent RNA helicase RhlB [Kaarinaea lacus]